MTHNSNIEIFKGIAGNYFKYHEQVKELDHLIEMIQNKMENVHSISFESAVSGRSYSEKPLVQLIEKKATLEKEKQYYLDLIKWTDNVIDSLNSGAVKALVWMSCIQGESLQSISTEFEVSKDHLYKIRKASLNRALDDTKMEILEEIQYSRQE